MTAEKACSKCGEVKSFEDFRANRKATDGLQSACKACQIDWSAANKEKKAEQDRRYRIQNREKVAAMKKKYVEENREKVSGYGKAYRDRPENKARIRAYLKDYYAAHREEARRQRAAFRVENRSRLNAAEKEKYYKYRDRILQQQREYRARPDVQQRIKAYQARLRDNLEDPYVLKVLTVNTNLKPSDIPPALVELKREHLKITRHLKELQHENR